MDGTPATPWQVVLPVKDRRHAKTRLQGAYPSLRADLALAFALDTVAAALAAEGVGRVLVVTDDDALGAYLPAGTQVLQDPGGGQDLDAAVRAALVAVERGPVAVLCADLPSLRPSELAAALLVAGGHERAVVPDADGTGTVLLTARDARTLRPSYGRGSARRHEVLGATRLDAHTWPGLRRDVDEPEHVAALLAAGTGPRTAEVLRRLDRRAG